MNCCIIITFKTVSSFVNILTQVVTILVSASSFSDISVTGTACGNITERGYLSAVLQPWLEAVPWSFDVVCSQVDKDPLVIV